jgi:uncharacterized protein (DUF2336 family)
MAYNDQKRLAQDGSSEERRELAGRSDIRPEILYYLASDPDTEVRRSIARNHKAPRHADLLLAKDEKPEVRTDVAEKIAEITVKIAGGEQNNVYRLTMDALEILARDQLLRVREVLAETLKDCPKAPVDIIERLALDREISVAEPVLENSPVLGNEFLLSVISSDPVQGALRAIARRVALGENVADAIVHNGDVEAIAELLGNDSAQIREETLDRIVDQASGEPKERTDLDNETISAIKEVVLRRLDADEIGALSPPKADRTFDDVVPEVPEGPSTEHSPSTASQEPTTANSLPDVPLESVVTKRVRQMYLDDELTEHEVSSALASGGQEFVIYAIALMSKTPIDVVSRAISMRSAKAIVALCWKADLSMRLATRVQMHLANIPPSDVLRATASDDYPLSTDEMRWQLEFISGLATA